MTHDEATMLAAHWTNLAHDAEKEMSRFDVGSIEWCERRAWYRECIGAANAYHLVARRMKGKGIAA